MGKILYFPRNSRSVEFDEEMEKFVRKMGEEMGYEGDWFLEFVRKQLSLYYEELKKESQKEK